MADPTKYTPAYSYSGWQASNPSKPLPADEVDNDFANIQRTTNETIDALKQIRRSDGKLANQSVGPDQLSPALTIGFTFTGSWVDGRSYSAGDGVVYGDTFYSARETHTADVSNAPGNAAYWNELFSLNDIVVTGGMALPRDSFVGDGVTKDFTLSFVPLSKFNLFVQVGGVVQATDAYSANGNVMTFVSPPPNGYGIEVRGFATVSSLVTPEDGSVTTAKLADLSVTDEKLADEAVTEAKICDEAVSQAKLAPSVAGLLNSAMQPTTYFLGADAVFTVGPGGDFSTINAAMETLTRTAPTYVSGGVKVQLSLLAGFVMAEQVHVDNIDLGWITVTSVDTTVAVDEAAITQELIGLEDNKPLFCGTNGATLPTLGCLFVYADNTTSADGITLASGSKVRFLSSEPDSAVPVSGVRNARKGLSLFAGSEAVCSQMGLTQGGGGSGAGLAVGVDFSGALMYAVHAQHGSRATLTRSNFADCEGTDAVYVIWNSFADIYQSDISGHTGSNAAVHARDASVVCARECNANNSTTGFHALHAATIDARSSTANDCANYGYLANGASFMDATAGSANNAGNRGVWASNGSTIEFDTGSATGALGTAAVGATAGSTINAAVVNVTGSIIGFYAENASTINARAGIASSCTYGFYAIQGSTINAQDGVANDCATRGVLATRASTINFRSGSASGGAGVIEAFESSSINAQGALAAGSAGTGIIVGNGSFINAGSSTGTLSQAANSLTVEGVVFK